MTVAPATINFQLYQYASFSEQTLLQDDAGAPIDLTGYTAFMQIRRERDDTTPLYTLTTADSTIILGGAAGTIAFAIPSSDTTPATAALLDPDGEVWVYDMLLNNENASPPVVDRIFEGSVFVHPSVSRPT